MSLNTAHADHGVLIHAGESIILYSDKVTVEFYGNDTPDLKGTKNGRMYLTTHRMIYNSAANSDPVRSFSFPFIAIQDVTVEQPMFGANFIKGKVRAQPNGNFVGEVKFKLTFRAGGAIEFGQAMMKAAHLASRHNAGAAPPPYTPPTGPWYAAPPPAYAPPPQGYYGWVPPYAAFPDQPPPNSVFVSNNPPPYPGVAGAAYPAGAGFSGTGASPSGPTTDLSGIHIEERKLMHCPHYHMSTKNDQQAKVDDEAPLTPFRVINRAHLQHLVAYISTGHGHRRVRNQTNATGNVKRVGRSVPVLWKRSPASALLAHVSTSRQNPPGSKIK